jgi:hypothetical protein
MPFFHRMQNILESFTRDWNSNENNRDKTYGLNKKLSVVKQDMQENLQLMIERDGKIEDAMVKGTQLQTASVGYRRHAR